MTKEEAYRVEKTIDEYLKFVSLVKRMREVQKEYKRYVDVVASGGWFKNNDEKKRYVELFHEKDSIESEVDECLEKMEI